MKLVDVLVVSEVLLLITPFHQITKAVERADCVPIETESDLPNGATFPFLEYVFIQIWGTNWIGNILRSDSWKEQDQV